MTDLKLVFLQAEAFRHTSHNVDGQMMQKNPHISLCGIVCAAFALELYLKCLIAMQMNKPKRDHNLVDLFAQLNAGTQKKVRDRINRQPLDRMMQHIVTLGGPADFDGRLKLSSEAFQRSRYAYEYVGKNQGHGWMANDIMEVVRETILDAQPSWKV